MRVATTIKPIDIQSALALVDTGAAFVDLRQTDQYLDVHIPGSIPLLYEHGPGMAARARDCIPLDVELVISAPDNLSQDDLANAAASLRGKGFTVAGAVGDAINGWASLRSRPASTEVLDGSQPPVGVLLAVGDPGAAAPPNASHIPVERLWSRIDEVRRGESIVVIAGAGVRAAVAVGILERHGFSNVSLWRSRRV